MEIFKNKFFLLGNVLLILVVIPITLFFIRQQTQTRSSAAPNTILSLTTAATAITPGQNFDVDVNVNPGTNLVSIIDMDIRYDPTKLEYVTITPNASAFPQTFKGPITSSGSVIISLSIGGDATKSISTQTKVATITFKPIAGTSGPSNITFFRDSSDPLKPTRVLSVADPDGAGENVLQNITPLTVNIGGTGSLTPTVGALTPTQGALTPTPTSTAGITPTPVPTGAALTPTPTSSVVPTPTGTASSTITPATNQTPICTGLNIDRATSGTAPYSLTFTGNGRDPDGTISKASFDFGDGPVQDVTSAGGIGTTTVSVQIAHTFRNAGSYRTTVTFTDNHGKISDVTAVCTKTIVVSSSSGTGATPGGTSGGTTSGGSTPRPTLPPTGSTTTTIGIVGGIILTIIGGALLLIL